MKTLFSLLAGAFTCCKWFVRMQASVELSVAGSLASGSPATKKFFPDASVWRTICNRLSLPSRKLYSTQSYIASEHIVNNVRYLLISKGKDVIMSVANDIERNHDHGI